MHFLVDTGNFGVLRLQREGDHTQDFHCRCILHLNVSKEFLSCILQAGTKKIHHVVDNQEPVVIIPTRIYCNRWKLLVMPQQIELLLLTELTVIDGCRYIGISIAQHRQSIHIDVVVNENN